MGNKEKIQANDFIKAEVLKLQRNSFVFRIITITVGYIGITLWLNAIRATESFWFVWTLIVIQFVLYFSIFIVSYQRSIICGLNKNFGIIFFIILTVLGRVNGWELLVIPLLVIIMLIVSAKNKNISEKGGIFIAEKINNKITCPTLKT